MNVMVLTDNELIYKEFNKLIQDKQYTDSNFCFYYSPTNHSFRKKYNTPTFTAFSIKDNIDYIIEHYDLIFSLHCKQIFPEKLVNCIRCINVHPGYNPYNRGYYPQVHSILNKLPIGVTIHEMDSLLDHGPIIIQEKVYINDWDTSYDVYVKLQHKEIELLTLNLRKLLDNKYITYTVDEGNLNTKKDFDALCQIDLDKKVSFKEAIDYLRAMTFTGYDNAYFIDENGNKIYAEIKLVAK
jgi:methionyl-tRNA formyltransferase